MTSEEWLQGLQACVSARRAKELGPLNRREAFSRNGSPLYFSELLKFVQHSAEFDTEGVSNSDISAAMSCVNTHRIDAHAKSIDESNYIELKASLDLLENVFLPPP